VKALRGPGSILMERRSCGSDSEICGSVSGSGSGTTELVPQHHRKLLTFLGY